MIQFTVVNQTVFNRLDKQNEKEKPVNQLNRLSPEPQTVNRTVDISSVETGQTPVISVSTQVTGLESRSH